jgi:hypothetical protein
MDVAGRFLVTTRAKIVGYLSLTTGSVRRADATIKLIRILPAHPVAMVLLARLARAWLSSTPSTTPRPRSTAAPGARPSPRTEE